jgi:hypothetical protein
MASGVSSYGASTWLSALFGVTSLPSSYYIALCVDQPGIDADGSVISSLEPPTGVGYARQSYATGSSNWTVNAGNLVNLNDIVYPAPTGDWGLLSHYVLCTATTAGQIYAFGIFDNPYFVTSGLGVLIPAGGIVIHLASLDVSIAP